MQMCDTCLGLILSCVTLYRGSLVQSASFLSERWGGGDVASCQ